jgi:hypothetical protein
MEIVTRKEAKDKELKRFNTGVPCPNNHESERYTVNNKCCECTKERSKKHYNLYPENYKISAKKWVSENRENHNANTKRWSSENKDKVRASGRKFDRKNLPEPTRDYPKDDLCECCGFTETRTNNEGLPIVLSLDHCHEKMEFRGWVCHSCNLMLGYAQDSEDRLLAGISYLRKSKKCQTVIN